MTADVMTFDEALAAEAERDNQPHVLLGNGFSISCRPSAFNYTALLEEATFSGAQGDLLEVFRLLGTTDFEKVIELLRLAGALADRYGPGTGIGEQLRHDAEIVREALAQTLAARHPNLPFDISADEYQAARQFLSNFRKIYTLNYDMLLYWAVMQELDPPVPTDDGFRNGDGDADYVVWEPYLDFKNQRLLFLHGALHLYDSGSEISKITWSRTGVPLVDQIRDALAAGRYPLIVTEGSSAEKEAKILHNAYLNHAIRSFAKIHNSLFIYGHSLADNDAHILRRIEEGILERLYVSVYGNPSSAANASMMARAEAMIANRSLMHGRPLAVRFFDAESARVWG